MKYARLDSCPTEDLAWCFAGTITHESTNWFRDGEPIGDRYPEDPTEVTVDLDADFPGIKLPDMIGNAQRLLMFSTKARDAFTEAKLDLGPHDLCPFALLNHKGREHSTDYAFVSPHGGHEIAHAASDFLRYNKSQKIYGCKRWVLAANKLDALPDLIRAEEMRQAYFVSERFIEVVRGRELTNFHFTELQHVV